MCGRVGRRRAAVGEREVQQVVRAQVHGRQLRVQRDRGLDRRHPRAEVRQHRLEVLALAVDELVEPEQRAARGASAPAPPRRAARRSSRSAGTSPAPRASSCPGRPVVRRGPRVERGSPQRAAGRERAPGAGPARHRHDRPGSRCWSWPGCRRCPAARSAAAARWPGSRAPPGRRRWPAPRAARRTRALGFPGRGRWCRRRRGRAARDVGADRAARLRAGGQLSPTPTMRSLCRRDRAGVAANGGVGNGWPPPPPQHDARSTECRERRGGSDAAHHNGSTVGEPMPSWTWTVVAFKPPREVATLLHAGSRWQ